MAESETELTRNEMTPQKPRTKQVTHITYWFKVPTAWIVTGLKYPRHGLLLVTGLKYPRHRLLLV